LTSEIKHAIYTVVDALIDAVGWVIETTSDLFKGLLHLLMFAFWGPGVI